MIIAFGIETENLLILNLEWALAAQTMRIPLDEMLQNVRGFTAHHSPTDDRVHKAHRMLKCT